MSSENTCMELDAVLDEVYGHIEKSAALDDYMKLVPWPYMLGLTAMLLGGATFGYMTGKKTRRIDALRAAMRARMEENPYVYAHPYFKMVEVPVRPNRRRAHSDEG